MVSLVYISFEKQQPRLQHTIKMTLLVPNLVWMPELDNQGLPQDGQILFGSEMHSWVDQCLCRQTRSV